MQRPQLQPAADTQQQQPQASQACMEGAGAEVPCSSGGQQAQQRREQQHTYDQLLD
jgi:hypothetical protein